MSSRDPYFQFAWDSTVHGESLDDLIDDGLITVAGSLPYIEYKEGLIHCKFHNSWGHRTSKCQQLRDQVQDWLDLGYIRFKDEGDFMIATADLAWPRVGQRRITLDLSPNTGSREPPGRNHKRPASNYTVPNNQRGNADDPGRQLVAKLEADRPSHKDKGKAVMRDDRPFPVKHSQPMSPRTREELERRIARLETYVSTHWAEAVPTSPAASEMDTSDSSGEGHSNEAPSPRQGVLTNPYIPPTSKSAIKERPTKGGEVWQYATRTLSKDSDTQRDSMSSRDPYFQFAWDSTVHGEVELEMNDSALGIRSLSV
ncbi:hypothetical protein ACLB2K_010323 [Fragaria x ananassa]